MPKCLANEIDLDQSTAAGCVSFLLLQLDQSINRLEQRFVEVRDQSCDNVPAGINARLD
jgi:hypothetical protein